MLLRPQDGLFWAFSKGEDKSKTCYTRGLCVVMALALNDWGLLNSLSVVLADLKGRGDWVVIPIDFFNSYITFDFMVSYFFAEEICYFLIYFLVVLLKLAFTLDGVWKLYCFVCILLRFMALVLCIIYLY